MAENGGLSIISGDGEPLKLALRPLLEELRGQAAALNLPLYILTESQRATAVQLENVLSEFVTTLCKHARSAGHSATAMSSAAQSAAESWIPMEKTREGEGFLQRMADSQLLIAWETALLAQSDRPTAISQGFEEHGEQLLPAETESGSADT